MQSSQSVLERARFNHRPHVLQSGCLDCHREIEVEEHLLDPDALKAELDDQAYKELGKTEAAVQNLPHIEVCADCHNPSRVSNHCVTCHDFHADKQRHIAASMGGG